MSDYGGLWKHENNQHTFVPRRRNVAAQVAEELQTVTHSYGGTQKKEREKTFLVGQKSISLLRFQTFEILIQIIIAYRRINDVLLYSKSVYYLHL